MVEKINNENFEVKTKNGVSLVKFGAKWCSPCRLFDGVLEELKSDKEIIDKKINIFTVDVDEEKDFVLKYGIKSIPHTIILKDGKPIENESPIIGLKNKAVIKEILISHS